MIKINFIVPSDCFTKDIKESVKRHEASSNFYKNENFDIKIFIAPLIENIQNHMIEADVVIARGLLATQLEQKYSDLLVVHIPIAVSEILHSILDGISEIRPKIPSIAIVGAMNMIYSASGVDKLLNLKVKINSYLQKSDETKNLQQTMANVISDERNLIICGYNTYQYIKKNYNQIVVREVIMTQESLTIAVEEAKHIALIRRNDLQNNVQYRDILDNVIEGVLVIDKIGRILSINNAAMKMLEINKSPLGKSYRSIFGPSKISQFLNGNTEYSNEIINYHFKTFVINKHQLFIHKDYYGTITILQEKLAILETETKLRKKLYFKGNIAKYNFEDIIGESNIIKNTELRAKLYATSKSNIWIYGETGTGKEIFAQSIHNISPYKHGPFVAINCAEFSKNLLESELFGYEEGAFTGALKGGKIGLLEIAHTGTCFLDEISEIPLDMQGKLLRFIQERTLRRIGSDAVIPVDVRIICATNKDLLEEVEKGNFRRDLYYRLNVLRLNLPNLHSRNEDVIILFEYYLKKLTVQKPLQKLTKEAEQYLKTIVWKGNVRELINTCECLSVIGPPFISVESIQEIIDPIAIEDKNSNVCTKRIGRRSFSEEQIKEALKISTSRAEVASKLGISTTSLWRYMKNFKIIL